MARLYNEVLGKEVQIPESPTRIASFSPAVTETLFLLGLGGRIAGVSAFCARPAAAREKKKLGSYNTVRDELLDELGPDLIFTVTGYQRDFAVKLSRKYPVYPLELPISVAGIIDFVVKVGLVAGAPDAGRGLGRDLLKSAAGLGTVKGVTSYVEIDLGGPVSFGRHSYVTDAFRLLGSSQIYEDARAEWLVPEPGKVETENPDAIFYEPKMFSRFREGDVTAMLGSRGWQHLRAAKLGNVFVTPGPLDFLAHHGPSFITEALPWLQERLRIAEARVDS